MNGGESLGRKVGEKPVALVFPHEVGEFIVTTVHLIGPDEAPFTDMDPLVGLVHTLVSEGVAVDDVLGKDVTGRFKATVLASGFEERPVLLREVNQEAFPTGRCIIGQQFDAVDAGEGPYGIVLILKLGVLSGFDAGLADREFASENLYEEVAVAASGLQETGVYPLRLRLHKVQHGIHLTGVGEHLPVSGHPVLGLDLGVHSALSLGTGDLFEKASGHKKKAWMLLSIPEALGSPCLNKSHPRQSAGTCRLIRWLLEIS